MPKLSIISWRDIPSQVIVKRGRESAKVLLTARFQEAIDRAAMRAGRGSSDAYLADWERSVARECGADMQAEAQAEAARLEAKYQDADLLALIRNHGKDGPPAAAGSDADANADADASAGADAGADAIPDPEADPR
jgi:hypothetical protein